MNDAIMNVMNVICMLTILDKTNKRYWEKGPRHSSNKYSVKSVAHGVDVH